MFVRAQRSYTNHKYTFLLSRVETQDEESAVAQVEQNRTSVRALTFLAPQGMPCSWGKEMYVIKRRASQGALLRKDTLSVETHSPIQKTGGRRLKDLRAYSKRILNNFDASSTERLLSSINTSALARTSSNPENQLISLWSAVEVLLSEPERDT